MRKAPVLIVLSLCVPMLGCKPHPGKILRGGDRIHRQEERQGRHHGLKRMCRDDIAKFCAGDQSKRERRQCLQSHLNEVSSDCKTAIESRGHKGGRKNRDRNDTDDSND